MLGHEVDPLLSYVTLPTVGWTDICFITCALFHKLKNIITHTDVEPIITIYPLAISHAKCP